MSSADESSDFEIYDEDATMSGRTPEEESSCREDILPYQDSMYVSYYDALQNNSTTGDNGQNGGPKRLTLNWPYYGEGNNSNNPDDQQHSVFESGVMTTTKSTSTAVPLSKRRRSSKQECFIEKLYKMATCDAHASVFGFSDDGSYIEIRTPSGLAQVLNQYFKHSNSSSFIRQLNNYGFKTMSSVSTGKNIQCFSHPQFRRGAPEDLTKITRKTAKILKKCKREIIKDLQTGEAACRKRVKELEQLNARLEREVARLEQQNAALVREIAMRNHNANQQQQQPQQPQEQDVTMIGSQVVQNPVLTSNASSYSSSLVDAMDVSQTHQLLSTPSRMLSPIHYQQQPPLLIHPPPQHLSYSSSASLATSTSSSSDPDSQPYFSATRPLPANDSIDSLESYYFEPVLEMVSDYSEQSPTFANYRVDSITQQQHPHYLASAFSSGIESGSGGGVQGEFNTAVVMATDKDMLGDYQMIGSSSSSSSSPSRGSPEVTMATPTSRINSNSRGSSRSTMENSSKISPA